MSSCSEDSEEADVSIEIRLSGTTTEQLTQESDDFFSEFRTWRDWMNRPDSFLHEMTLGGPRWSRLAFYMTWLELFLQGNEEYSIPSSWLAGAGEAYGVQATAMWIWLQLEHSSDQEIENVLMEAAEVFWECRERRTILHPALLMMEAGALYRVTDWAMRRSTDARAALRFQSVMREAA